MIRVAPGLCLYDEKECNAPTPLQEAFMEQVSNVAPMGRLGSLYFNTDTCWSNQRDPEFDVLSLTNRALWHVLLCDKMLPRVVSFDPAFGSRNNPLLRCCALLKVDTFVHGSGAPGRASGLGFRCA